MKSRDWRDYLEEQHRLYDKTIFTVTELSHAANTSLPALNVELDRLRKQGVIEQYAQGRYGLPGRVTPERLAQHLDGRAYITATFGLYRHRMITQVPTTITCFTNRRHNRSRERHTPLGTFVFVCVSQSIYSPPAGEALAPPEQALFDFVYLMRRRGVMPETVVTFRNLGDLRQASIRTISPRYPETVRNHVWNIMKICCPQ